jgi:hypothetical protein
MTNFTRLTVVGSARKAELVVPDDESIGGLIPRLMELLEEPNGSVARPLTLVRATGEQLDASLSSSQQELADGEQLRLIRADESPPPPEVADVTDVVGDSYAERSGRWSATAREAVGATAIGAAVSVALLVSPPPPTTGLLLLAAASAVATLLGRLGKRWSGIALTAAAAGAAVPVAREVLGSAGGPPTLVLWAAVTAALVWVVLGFGVGAGLRRRSAVAGGALGAVLAALPVVLVAAGITPQHSVAVGAVAASVACGLLPWYALSSSGLSGLDDQVLAGQPSARGEALRTVDDAYRSLSWSTVAVAGALGVTASLLVVSQDRWELALGIVVTAITALRTRALPLVIQQVPLVVAASAATLVGVLARRPGLQPFEVAAVLIVLAGVVAVGVGVRPALHQRARLRRWGNLVEAIMVIALLPLLLGVFGVYGDLVAAFQ